MAVEGSSRGILPRRDPVGVALDTIVALRLIGKNTQAAERVIFEALPKIARTPVEPPTRRPRAF